MSEPSVTLIVHTEESKLNEVELEKELEKESEQKTKIVGEFTTMIENFAQTLIESFKDKHIDENNIIDFVVKAMMLVETHKKLSGQDKKNVVIKMLLRLTEITTLDENRKLSLKFLIDTLAPNMIDTIVSASKGVLNLNKNGKKFCCC
jgi:hypothetical protein